jgi:GTP-binding protein
MKITSATFVKSAVNPSQYPADRYPEIAFAGKSNVGKSSLINSLVNRRKLALTSATPGKTRLLNFFLINERFSFVDLPGYGFAKVPLEMKKDWGPMVEKYLEERKCLRLVILILDVRRDPSEDDFSLMQWLRHYGRAFLVVLTKADKLSRTQSRLRLESMRQALGVVGEDITLFSTVTGEGKGEIWKTISEIVVRKPENGNRS